MQTYRKKEIALLAAQKIVFAIVAGVAVWLVPLLQHWLVYVVWGPVLGCVFIWAYWECRDVSSEKAEWRSTPMAAIIVGGTHIVAVSLVWLLITKWL